MKASFAILLLFLLSVKTDAQRSAFTSFWKLSCPERWWVISHPFIAHKAFRITAEARTKCDILVNDSLLDGDPLGGQVDAFRHAYWMARLAQNMKWKKALSLGIAHEKANKISFKKSKMDEEGMLPDSVSSAMDLFNNGVGVTIGCNFKYFSKEEIYNSIIENIIKGKLKVVFKDANKRELNCDGTLLDQNLFKGKWDIPKCLVGSDILFK